MSRIRQVPYLRIFALTVCVGAIHDAGAFSTTIAAGSKAIYLQVGNGSFSGNYSSGGTPQNNATINTVSVTVPAASLGNATAQAMTSDSSQSRSFYDGFTFCTPPAQVYIGGFFRTPGVSASATLTATSPTSLTNGSGNTIPFSQISWTSSGIGDGGIEVIPGGTFNGSTQTLATFAPNTWNESCHTFSYANAVLPAAGTFTGRVLYTLSAP